jgi:hypothetical protein
MLRAPGFLHLRSNDVNLDTLQKQHLGLGFQVKSPRAVRILTSRKSNCAGVRIDIIDPKRVSLLRPIGVRYDDRSKAGESPLIKPWIFS